MKVPPSNIVARPCVGAFRFWVTPILRSARDWINRTILLHLHPPRTLA
jgi:hypothetical protein